MPLPDPRPSVKIARLFPQVDPLNSPSKDQAKTAPAAVRRRHSDGGSPRRCPVPLPAARPIIAPSPEPRRTRNDRHYRRR